MTVVEKRVLVDPALVSFCNQVRGVATVVIRRADTPPTPPVLLILLFRVLLTFVLHRTRLLFLILIVVELVIDVFVGFICVDLQLPLLAHDGLLLVQRVLLGTLQMLVLFIYLINGSALFQVIQKVIHVSLDV